MFFLPGAGGSATFWRPVAERLALTRTPHFFAWPGLGHEPHEPSIRSMDDLVSTVISTLHEPADLVAQSMGGVVALRVALAAPHYVRRLVLAATSGGIPISDREGTDWRSDYRREFPLAAPWITDIHEDLSPQLAGVTAPCLLLWGGADPISPPSVGRRLLELLPDARLHIVDGGRHDLAQTHASEIAPLIAAHLR